MKYFTVNELIDSDFAKAKKIDNNPKEENIINSLKDLINNCLDPLRGSYGKPIKVNSGYRSPTLNKAIGGVSTSQHLKGQAADITGGSLEENKKIFELAKKLPLGFDQLINESNFSWVHISWKPSNNRNQILNL